ncbi:MAG: RNA polymerase sigma factor [Bacillota bacterium]
MEREQVEALVKQNDDVARRALFEAYYQRTFGVVYQITRSRESAEDLTQDAFIKAFRSLHQLRERDKFGAWLAVIATNLARNHLKRERRLFFSDDLTRFESDSGDAEAEVMRDLEIEKVRQAVRALPPDQYQVVILQYYYDLKIEDIAAMLQISAGTVKSRLFRARQKLARILEPNFAEHTLPIKGGGDGR